MEPDNRKRHNRQKYRILNFALNAGTVTAEDLTFNFNLKPGNAWERLSKMHAQGYLRKNKRGTYRLSVIGLRVLKQLQHRKNIERVTGREISFNLKKGIPSDVFSEYSRLQKLKKSQVK